MAAQGLRDMGDGPEAVANPAEAAALRARGRRVMAISALGAALATALVCVAAAW